LLNLCEDDVEHFVKARFNLLNICRGTDNLILAGHVEGDSAVLEVYVYNDIEDALYIHHDILLPSLPLALGKYNISLTDAFCF
jgi:hypothetical protein